LCEDVHRIFQELTGMGKMVKLKLLHAPFTLHSQLMNFIENEIVLAKAGNRQKLSLR
jgi:polyphosphate kinase